MGPVLLDLLQAAVAHLHKFAKMWPNEAEGHPKKLS